ncbi:prolipoprotein diacylglyceryl transferase [Candidatus Omnitrophota bacterium]
MYPILFSIGPIKVFSYGFSIAVGLFLAFVMIRKRGDYKGIAPDQLIDLMIATTCIGLVGARILYVIRFNELYRDNWFAVFKVWEGGLILYGGVICALLFLLVYVYIKKKSFFLITDAIVPYFVFVQGFGRIGCFLNGCCGGRVTDSMFGIMFPNTNYLVYPTQLYSALFCFCVAWCVFKANKPTLRVGFTTTVYFLTYPVGRFAIEFVRVNAAVAGGYSSAQIISVIFFVMAAIVFLIQKYWKPNEQ